MENLDKLVNELRNLPNETQWLEFKHNNYEPTMIGQDISALANSAAMCEKSSAYMLWGIDDKTHEIVGTDYNLQTLKKGRDEQNRRKERPANTVNGNQKSFGHLKGAKTIAR